MKCFEWTAASEESLRGARSYDGEYHPEDEVFAQWFGRGGIETAGFNSWDGRYTSTGTRTTTDIGGPYASFGSYAQGC